MQLWGVWLAVGILLLQGFAEGQDDETAVRTGEGKRRVREIATQGQSQSQNTTCQTTNATACSDKPVARNQPQEPAVTGARPEQGKSSTGNQSLSSTVTGLGSKGVRGGPEGRMLVGPNGRLIRRGVRKSPTGNQTLEPTVKGLISTGIGGGGPAGRIIRPGVRKSSTGNQTLEPTVKGLESAGVGGGGSGGIKVAGPEGGMLVGHAGRIRRPGVRKSSTGNQTLEPTVKGLESKGIGGGPGVITVAGPEGRKLLGPRGRIIARSGVNQSTTGNQTAEPRVKRSLRGNQLVEFRESVFVRIKRDGGSKGRKSSKKNQEANRRRTGLDSDERESGSGGRPPSKRYQKQDSRERELDLMDRGVESIGRQFSRKNEKQNSRERGQDSRERKKTRPTGRESSTRLKPSLAANHREVDLRGKMPPRGNQLMNTRGQLPLDLTETRPGSFEPQRKRVESEGGRTGRERGQNNRPGRTQGQTSRMAPVQKQESDVPAVGYTRIIGVGDYKLFNTKKTWAEANRICNSEGGHLVVIGSDQERTAVKRIVDRSNLGPTSISEFEESPPRIGDIFIGAKVFAGDNIITTVTGETLFIPCHSRSVKMRVDKCAVIQSTRNCYVVKEQCNLKLNFMCEIELKNKNINTPTGSPIDPPKPATSRDQLPIQETTNQESYNVNPVRLPPEPSIEPQRESFVQPDIPREPVILAPEPYVNTMKSEPLLSVEPQREVVFEPVRVIEPVTVDQVTNVYPIKSDPFLSSEPPRESSVEAIRAIEPVIVNPEPYVAPIT